MDSGVRWGREARRLWAGEGLGYFGAAGSHKCLSRAVTCVRCMFHTALWLLCGARERATGPRGAGRLARGCYSCQQRGEWWVHSYIAGGARLLSVGH